MISISKSFVPAYAKLNLFLHIVGKKANFHLLQSLFVFLKLKDVLEVLSSESGQNNVTFSGLQSEFINADNNSISTVLKFLPEYTCVQDKFSIHVQKNIPIASGLGGGSVDAVALLLFLQKVYSFDDEAAILIANHIGTDTVSCFKSRWQTSFIEGCGDNVSSAGLNGSFKHIVLLNSYEHISAGRAYSLYKQPFTVLISEREFDMDFITNKTSNDLERFVAGEYKIVKDLLKFLQTSEGCIFSRMSGSGATCVGIFDSEESALYSVSEAKKLGWWAAYTELVDW